MALIDTDRLVICTVQSKLRFLNAFLLCVIEISIEKTRHIQDGPPYLDFVSRVMHPGVHTAETNSVGRFAFPSARSIFLRLVDNILYCLVICC
jgi:hypothetical protein